MVWVSVMVSGGWLMFCFTVSRCRTESDQAELPGVPVTAVVQAAGAE